ncbi:FadR/GntR family transcriptional regulator [Georgenia halophila]|uniref:FadR/GntR family transcriptional regulator n=1 Tax=Georgenia halophila TaxID=620889 RepID=A0ABP8LBY8_9MICO
MPEAAPAWSSVTKSRTYQQVVEQIRERILDGRLGPGSHLPNEREFAQQLGCSRTSLREALRILESQGIIDIRVGGGPDGGAVVTSAARSSMGGVLELQLALGQYSYDEIIETRIALESWSCLRAASSADRQSIGQLEEILTAMEDPEIDVREFNRLDVEFHALIARSANNALTQDFMSIIRDAIHSQMIEAYNALPDWRGRVVPVKSEHRAILEAIANHEGQRASELVIAHINDFFRSGVAE